MFFHRKFNAKKPDSVKTPAFLLFLILPNYPEKGKQGNGESVWFGVRGKDKIINNVFKLIIVSLILLLTFPVLYQNHPDSLFPRFHVSSSLIVRVLQPHRLNYSTYILVFYYIIAILCVASKNVRFRASLGKTCSLPGKHLLPA